MGSQWISDAEMAAAERITFGPNPRAPITGWDNSLYVSTSPFKPYTDDFAITLTKGATYRLSSFGAAGPSILQVLDADGNLLASDIDGSSADGRGFIGEFVATYTGKHYISAGWNLASNRSVGALFVDEDLDTATSVIMLVLRDTDPEAKREVATPYTGPVAWLQNQLLGTDGKEIVLGAGGNDFLNLLGGDDAANAGAGDDVLDGGAGSNFLTGGAGHDVFFLDGRGGRTTWSTIADWQAGEEMSVWGWRPGISTASWAAREGALGYEGVSLHADLNGDGSVDVSVTWTGLTQANLPQARESDGLLWFA